MENTFYAKLHADKSKNPVMKVYRYLTLDECKRLSNHCQVIDKYGNIREVKITSVKTWKTRPDVLVGWKYGLYEYGSELLKRDSDNRFFVVEVE
jgi:hypothetical protein